MEVLEEEELNAMTREQEKMYSIKKAENKQVKELEEKETKLLDANKKSKNLHS